MNRNQHHLPNIVIPASEYDRLIELADAVKPATGQLSTYLHRELQRANVVSDEQVTVNIVRIGSLVTYLDNFTNRPRTVTLCWPHEADIDQGRLSVLTPIGAALLGLRAGQTIDWPAPVGSARTLTVIAVHNDPHDPMPTPLNAA